MLLEVVTTPGAPIAGEAFTLALELTDRGSAEDRIRIVGPSPATHAILRLLKAGDSVSDTKGVLFTFTRTTVVQLVCQTLFVPKNSV